MTPQDPTNRGRCQVACGISRDDARRAMTLMLATVAVLLAAFIKGAIGFGFPTLGTPLLALFIDVKTAVVVLIVPNMVMDAIQFVRGGAPVHTVRRFASLVVF